MHAMMRKQIINEWNSALEADVTAFTNQAVRVAQWDKQLRASAKDLDTLANQVRTEMMYMCACCLHPFRHDCK